MLNLTFANGKGVVRLTRFERVHLIGLLRLQNQKQQQTDTDIGILSYDEANNCIDSGECGLVLRRMYTDSKCAYFNVGKGGMLKEVI